MKALSIRQPFAALIADGQKRLEIRSWQTDYRGPLLICAAQANHALYEEFDFRTGVLKLANRSAKDKYKVNSDHLCFYGKMLCVVELVGIKNFMALEMSENDACIDWIPDHFAWELENPRWVNPVEIKGKLRLFEVDDSLIKYL